MMELDYRTLHENVEMCVCVCVCVYMCVCMCVCIMCVCVFIYILLSFFMKYVSFVFNCSCAYLYST